MTTTNLTAGAADRAEKASRKAVAACKAGNLEATQKHCTASVNWATKAYDLADNVVDADAEKAAWSDWRRAAEAAALAEFATRMATRDSILAEIAGRRG